MFAQNNLSQFKPHENFNKMNQLVNQNLTITTPPACAIPEMILLFGNLTCTT
jgi:hypothetical protein